MMSFLLDTNVVSETRRDRPHRAVTAWFRQQDANELHISVLTLAEIAKGAAQLKNSDPPQSDVLFRWLDRVRAQYLDRTIGINSEIAETWGQLTARRPLPVVDGLLAATALVHGLTFVTRDTRDVAGTGVTVFNPWRT